MTQIPAVCRYRRPGMAVLKASFDNSLPYPLRRRPLRPRALGLDDTCRGSSDPRVAGASPAERVRPTILE